MRDIDTVDSEELEAAASIHDAIMNGTHEQIQAEAVEWLRNFGRAMNAFDTLSPNSRKQ
jgi:hypothetical protein